jgi:hypothetical protein
MPNDDLMSEPLKDVSEGFWARINHPVIGVFVTSSILWNWEIIYYIFRGNGTTKDTVDFVYKSFLNWNNLGNLIIFPVAITLLYLISAPALHEGYFIYKIWWNGFATREKPLFKFQYEKVYEDYKRQITEMEKKHKSENDLHLTEKTKLETTISNLNLQNDYLRNSNLMYKNANFHVPGYRHFSNANELLTEFNGLRAAVERFNHANAKFRDEIADKEMVIKKLEGTVADLKGRIPPP